MRSGLQHSLAAEDDRPERPAGFFAPAAAGKVVELWARIRRFDFEIRPIHKTAGGNNGAGELKLDFSGTTNYTKTGPPLVLVKKMSYSQ